MIFNLIINDNGYCGGYSQQTNANTIEVNITDEQHFLEHIGAYKQDGTFDSEKWDELVAEWGNDDH